METKEIDIKTSLFYAPPIRRGRGRWNSKEFSPLPQPLSLKGEGSKTV